MKRFEVVKDLGMAPLRGHAEQHLESMSDCCFPMALRSSPSVQHSTVGWPSQKFIMF